MALSHEQRGGSFGPSPSPSRARAEEDSRPVRFAGEWIDTPILRGAPEPGTTATSPVVFELPEATLVLPPSWSARVDEFGSILATRLTGESGDPGRTSLFVREGSPDSPAPENQ
jgi:N-methylhydantoinase A/oxoprolinase/acetone carboxylase beta subunit